MIKRWVFVLALLAPSFFSYDQKLRKSDRTLVSQLQSHIQFLSSDQLEGRRAGTEGEVKARDYISKQFAKIGLVPKGDGNSWYQTFEIYDGKQVNSATHFVVNGQQLKLHDHFFPLSFSPQHSLEEAVVMALAESGVPWFVDLKEVVTENEQNPHFDLHDYLKIKANAAAEKGAQALIVYNTSPDDDELRFQPKDRSESSRIPVIYITDEAKNKFFNDELANLDLKLKVDIGTKTRTSANVIGFVDNGASSTIVIGAHYDHLGYGEDGNSLLRTVSKEIHNGADDNASGTAAIIELARLLKNSRNKNSNYLFIAFSGEELGLNGSKFFVDHPPVSIGSIKYMINLDMVGRLKDNALTVGGYGTSPAWGNVFTSIPSRKNFKIKFDSSGTGPSDHTSFYRKNIPVLFFFTGIHPDYHRPTDDADKINYIGQLQIIKLISELIGATNGMSVAFTPTREVQMSTTARFAVSLGIMPDYTFSGNGVKVDGVSEGRPAQKAGLEAGDVILNLGGHSTSSLEAYMQALSKFKKGDKVKVMFKRKDDTREAEVEF